ARPGHGRGAVGQAHRGLHRDDPHRAGRSGAHPPGALPGRAGRRPGVEHAAAARLCAPRRAGARRLRRDGAVRVRGARQGHRVAGRPPPAGPPRRGRPARQALPAAGAPGQRDPRRRRLRQRAAAAARPRAARAGLPGQLRPRRRQRRPAVRPSRRQADGRLDRGHDRRRLPGPARAGQRRPAGRARADRLRRRLRLRADGHAAGRRRPRGRARRAVPGGGGGVHGLRHRRLHDLRAAGRGRRRPHPDGALLRRGAGVPRRPGALGRRRHGPGRHGRRHHRAGSAPV
ncbi:MAG: Dihydroorotate dehydrogenase (NAD(+)), electron transfer subunit, partial [uncultured Frankineae bacterium]